MAEHESDQPEQPQNDQSDRLESWWRSITESSPDYVIVVDAEHRVQYVNRLEGHAPQELLGRSVYSFVSPQCQAKMANCFARVLETGEPDGYEVDYTSEDGEIRRFHSRVGPIEEEGRIVGFTVCARDITARKEAEKRLQEKQRLLRRLLALQERERSMISWEIRDGLVQQMVGAQMQVEAGLATLQGENVQSAGCLGAAVSLLQYAIEDARRLIGELRPLMLEGRTVVEAVAELVGDVRFRQQVQIQFHSDLKHERFEPMLEATVFRIVQQALTNVVRHSRAVEADVRLAEREGRLELEVVDQGVGFDVEAVPQDRYGLESIRQRARLFGGEARIESQPRQGTRVLVTLPVQPAGE